MSDWNTGKIARPCHIVYLDLCKFSTFNRLFGHHLADKLLDEVESVLRAHVRRESSVYRWGGDEFILFIPVDAVELMPLIERLRVTVPVAFRATAKWLEERDDLRHSIDVLDQLMERQKWAQV